MTTKKRIDPLGICAEADSATEGSRVTSRLDLTSTNVCTVCRKQMTPILAHGIPAFVCWEHRVVLPQENAGSATLGEQPAEPAPPISIFSETQHVGDDTPT